MAHEIDMSNNRANMAYAGAEPWHGLGFKIDADASIDEWREAAGLNWSIKKGGLVMRAEDGTLHDAADLNRSILYRDDTLARLSVMSTSGFHVVQPDEILSFIGDSVKAMGWKMETAGSLQGGRKIWAMANIGEQFNLGTKLSPDIVKGYLLAASACDGTMASEFKFTTQQVVCKNTLEMARDDKAQQAVKVYHYNALDIEQVKKQLGIAPTVWARFIENAKRAAAIKLTDKKAVQILRAVYTKKDDDAIDAEFVEVDDAQFLKDNMTARHVLELYKGEGIGAHLASQRNTAWGLVSATTQFYDHESLARSVDNRINSAWFGAGAVKKQQVFDACLQAA